jgi:hypothetical protein
MRPNATTLKAPISLRIWAPSRVFDDWKSSRTCVHGGLQFVAFATGCQQACSLLRVLPGRPVPSPASLPKRSMPRLLLLVFLILATACTSSGRSRAVPVSAGQPSDPSRVGLFVTAPTGRVADTVGYVAAVAGDADVAALRLRERAARLGADAVVDVQLRITHFTVETSGRAVRWH